MDAVKLYNDWKSSPDTKIFAEIADVPESSGGIDIADIKSAKSCFYMKDGKLCGEITFEKHFKSFTVYLLNVSKITDNFIFADSGEKITVSVENGLENPALLIKQGNEIMFYVDFQYGRIAFDSAFADF